jgi:tetratricopeptide (TPR) repeat protein
MRRNFNDALAMYEGALALRRRYLVADHRSTGTNEVSIAETLVELERYDEAMRHLAEGERIIEHGSAREAWTKAWILTVRGEILAGKRQFGAAIPVLEQALELFGDKANKINDLNHGLAMWTLARALHGQGRDGDRVRSLAERAGAIFAAQGAVQVHNRDAVAHFLDGLPARQTPQRP